MTVLAMLALIFDLSMEKIVEIIDGVKLKNKLSVCFDINHAYAGYDIVNDLG